MFKEETKELKMSNEFRKKIEMICKFACVKPSITNGNNETPQVKTSIVLMDSRLSTRAGYLFV